MKFFVVLLIFFTHWSIAQEDYFSGENIADAKGAVEILNAGSYQIEFTGSSGLFKDFKPYPELENVKEKNTLFFKYTAPYDCRMTFNAFSENQKVQFFLCRLVIINTELETLLNLEYLFLDVNREDEKYRKFLPTIMMKLYENGFFS